MGSDIQPVVEAESIAEPDEQVLIRLESDFAEDGSYGLRTLTVSKSTISILEPNGVRSLTMPIAEVKSARNEPLVGGGRMEIATVAGDIVPVISYSLTLAAKFSEAARGIEQLAKGEDLLIKLKDERLRCGRCNRLLPEKDGVCPACLHRGKTMLRIGKFLAPYKKQASILALLSFTTTLLSLVIPLIQGELIDKVLQPQRDLALLGQLMAGWLAILAISAVLAGC